MKTAMIGFRRQSLAIALLLAGAAGVAFLHPGKSQTSPQPILSRIIREGPGLAALRGLIGIVFVASKTR